MLSEMLKNHKHFKELPVHRQEIFLALATYFQTEDGALYLSPEELPLQSSLGNKQLWEELLAMEPTRQFIKTQMAHHSQIAMRKSFQSLQRLAESGNVQAAKEINELSGIMNQTENNRIVVLHYIQRPKVQEVEA